MPRSEYRRDVAGASIAFIEDGTVTITKRDGGKITRLEELSVTELILRACDGVDAKREKMGVVIGVHLEDAREAELENGR